MSCPNYEGDLLMRYPDKLGNPMWCPNNLVVVVLVMIDFVVSQWCPDNEGVLIMILWCPNNDVRVS